MSASKDDVRAEPNTARDAVLCEPEEWPAREADGWPVGVPRPPRGEDLPSDDGEPMETWRHRAQMNLLIESLEEAWRDRRDFYVGGNMGLYFSQTQAEKNDFRAPDVFIVLDTNQRERRSWVVWEEDGRVPDVVVELVSESTEHVDRGRKKTIYERVLRVPFYVIYDPFSARLDVFQLDSGHRHYVAVEADGEGRCEVSSLGLLLGVVNGTWRGVEAPWLRWIDPAGNVLRTADEIVHAHQLRADLAAKRAEQEAKRAAQEAERAAQEAERAAQEAERASRAEAEIAHLRAELARRGG
jgi:Uma2 family endonuclease